MAACPMSTGSGWMASSDTRRWPPARTFGRLRRASVVSKATTQSAHPGSLTIDRTPSLPKRTTVVTAPPRCDMPWISDTFAS